MLNAIALFVELLQSRVHSFAAEFRNLDALDDRVLAVFAGHRIAVDHAFRDAVATVGGDAHRHPVALARAADPVAPVVDRRVGRACRRGQPARAREGGPRASMIAAPRFWSGGMKVCSSQAWSLIIGQTFLPSASAWKMSGYCVA